MSSSAIARPGPLRPEPLISIRSAVNRRDPENAQMARPVWTNDRVPIQVLTPMDRTAERFVVDRYVLRPHPGDGIVYVTPTEVTLLDFSLTLRRTLRPDGSIAITDGSALFSITVDSPGGLRQLATLRDWNTALRRDDLRGDWKFSAEPRRGLMVSLELPPAIAASNPLVVTSSVAGVATVAVELTELGALTWKAALEQGAGATLAGIFHVATSAPAADRAALRLDRRSLDTALGHLLAGRGPADIRYIDPQQTVQGRIVVVGSEFIEQTVVAARPNQGQAPTSQVFPAAGGQVEVFVTTQDVGSVVIDWSAQVAFTPLGWPVVPASGTLGAARTWTEIVKPESWFVNYLVMAIAVDNRGQAQPVEAGTARLQGVLNFTAPYVANGLLNSAFPAEYLAPVSVALPRYPGEPFGELVLTLFATRNGVGGTGSRRLTTEETTVVALVYPDARVVLRTGSDALAETSTAADMLRLLESLC